MTDQLTLINQVYQAFNARDIDAVFLQLHPDVQWANGWEGGYVFGHDELRSYWLRQWQEVDPMVEPSAIQESPTNKVEVTVHQLIRDRQGNVLMDGLVKHIYTFDQGKIMRMDIEKL